MSDKWNKDKVLQMANERVIVYSGKTLCDNYKNPLERCQTPAQAIRLFKNCISWALQERYPTKEELLQFADKDTLAENGVYIDREFNGECINDFICCVFINCTGIIKTGYNMQKKILPMFYLSEGSGLEIIPDRNLLPRSIPIELYYGSNVYLSNRNADKFIVYDYNHLTAKENTGFTEDDENQKPDIANELL